MPTQEERLITVEQALKRFSEDMKDLKHHVTMLIGLTGREEMDYRETKISLRAIEENVESWDRRFDRIEEHVGNSEQRLNAADAHFETIKQDIKDLKQNIATQDQKLDQMLLLLTTLAPEPEQEK